ncbi:CDP-diacylglycerol--serine O-phosphatidyltransferase [bacterium]|nr:CDP-diacylglycerol--serine O-phosphatidyltransferase [bacterium]
MKRSPKRHLPSLVTSLNLLAGFLSVIHSIHEDYVMAAWLIVIASVMDVLDGKVARLVKSSSEFGVELDSLADVSSFGFAPAILIYKAYFEPWGAAGILISFLPLVFGGIRLARFNSQLADIHEKDSFFKGLPIPSSAISLAAFVMFEFSLFGGINHKEVLVGITVLVSALMVSKIRYDAMPNFSFRKHQDTIKLLIMIVATPFLILFPAKLIFPAMMVFILTGLLRALIDLFKHHDDGEDITDIPAIE